MAISVKSFSSIWYWIFTGIAWSMTCHYTLGVPHDMLVRAHSKGGTHADDAEALAAMQVRRLTNLFSKGGTFVVAVVAFLLAMVATFGFYYGYELAQASFMLLAPLVLVQIYMVRLAFRVKERGLVGAQLRKALTRRRFWNQVIGLFSIFLSAVLAFFSFVKDLAFWYQGGWGPGS